MTPGVIHKTNNSGNLQVIEYRSWINVLIKFISTGYETSARVHNIRTGKVKDKLKPTVLGVGFIGDGKYRPTDGKNMTEEYARWSGMLTRCYSSQYLDRFPSYKGCTVCEEWHNFQNFAKWYNENHPKDGKNYEIDKDLSNFGDSGKIYSPETCLFVTPQVNTEEAHAKSYTLIDPSGKVINIYNMKKFCEENNLNDSHMISLSKGKLKQHKGWTRIVGS